MNSSLHSFSKCCMHYILEKGEAILDEIPIFMLKKVQWLEGVVDRTKLSLKSVFSISYSTATSLFRRSPTHRLCSAVMNPVRVFLDSSLVWENCLYSINHVLSKG